MTPPARNGPNTRVGGGATRLTDGQSAVAGDNARAAGLVELHRGAEWTSGYGAPEIRCRAGQGRPRGDPGTEQPLPDAPSIAAWFAISPAMTGARADAPSTKLPGQAHAPPSAVTLVVD
jgi:hypothetical protein